MRSAPALSRAARQDFDEAQQWYAARSADTAVRFGAALQDLLRAIGRTPELFPVISGRIRRARLLDFPYGVYYYILAERVRVIAIQHLRRDPRLAQRRR